MEQTKLKANGLCVVFKTNESRLDLWKTAILNLKRAKYLRDEITRVRIIYGNKFDSVKLQVADKDDIITIYSIQFFNTGSVTVQGI